MEQVNGYSLKKQKLKQWIYEHKLTQPYIAKKLGLTTEEFKRKLTNREMFTENQIRTLTHLMGAKAAFQVIYFPDAKFRLKVYKKVFEFEKGLV